ncbi:transmembrane channel-like protein 6b isoform X1 [Gambusia affinis]|uniref:transmembrane channel-like protein 6b isoform X1 n=1 Tax=Gambusia affinis TaxID=33528 RepID=UPI001CDD301D|nr:transmembrane channel-like protein 6b isoform X1 [Gambusia affinis]XP_043970208.1 transmembrane channel-like protein 6b isoform X1 [Gambusia affinis]XP_043970209.1 transmembrane channel-like protein 6b isoform X1 [Gambusia affinis]XP_043970210.1 transmembrane channel-like protein 6b isoform X1 [Gambusia affinis]XP_043970211.1 transmembrane channel-like protein 6b isoform X1 [Gambusia affinis]
MAHNVNFDLSHPGVEAGLESPADEEVVHDSFSQLIEEESQREGLPDAIELQHQQRNPEDEGPDNVAYEDRGRRMGSDDTGEEEGERQTDSLLKDRWSSATLKILSSMPSRTIGRSQGAILSQYFNRTTGLRKRTQKRASIKDFSRSARPSIRGYGVEVDTTDSAEKKQERLVKNLQDLSAVDRVRMLKEMPLNLSEKKSLRRLTLKMTKQTRSSRNLRCCSYLKFHIILALRHSWYSCLSFLHSLHLWQMPLKRVSGRFGSGVLSYFLFLKTLLFFNVFLFLVLGSFLVVPQAVYPPERLENRTSFTGLELLTGGGYFSNTLLYYGYYSNHTLPSCSKNNTSSPPRPECDSKSLSYNMPLAYFFTIGLSFFITCIILVYSMSKSFGQSFRIDKSNGMLAMKVFCSWDFKVIKKSSVKLLSENICTQLKELLGEAHHSRTRSTTLDKLIKLMIHGLGWTLCIGATAGCVVGIYYFSDYMHKEQQESWQHDSGDPGLLKEASLLALPVLVSFINLMLPILFQFTAWMEKYDSPSLRTFVSLSRNLILKVSVLGVLCFHWLKRVAGSSSDNKTFKCWESFVGQDLYRFLTIDFIFTLLATLFGELLWRLFSDKVLKRNRRPEFDIAKNVLDLIYGQTLAWLGLLFTPLLPAVQILKLLLLFYIKMSSVMMNCQPPSRPYRVSQMTTIFITLLCFPSFLGASVCVTYTMWRLPSSESCGPFRGNKTMIQAGKQRIVELVKENPNLYFLAQAHTYLVENPFFLFVGAAIFLIVIYFQSQVVDGQRKIIALLQEQIENEGEDKKFLITRLQSIHERKRTPARNLTIQDSAC